jgi:uncharacterized protein YbcI
MNLKSRGEVEDAFTKAIIKFEKEHLGRGPEDARTFILQEMVLIRLKGILTPAEVKLAQDREGQALVKETRRQLLESSRPIIENLVRSIVGLDLVSMHTDTSTKTGERIIVLVVEKNLDELFLE